ncbi:hypothetical protein CDAR_583821 [Caerostris darwini]|uniref:Uncharacterized protein n=1 Tax=Caerostris darwini TaxID=1538125 RepID=A0AAV4RF51_9ARAC|nr:hypothetical protein CDAR_583821 [Caerostris darwini]
MQMHPMNEGYTKRKERPESLADNFAIQAIKHQPLVLLPLLWPRGTREDTNRLSRKTLPVDEVTVDRENAKILVSFSSSEFELLVCVCLQSEFSYWTGWKDSLGVFESLGANCLSPLVLSQAFPNQPTSIQRKWKCAPQTEATQRGKRPESLADNLAIRAIKHPPLALLPPTLPSRYPRYESSEQEDPFLDKVTVTGKM